MMDNLTYSTTRMTITSPIIRSGRRDAKLLFKLLSESQKVTEMVVHTGIRPLLCVLGLMACIMFLRSVYRKRVKDLSYHLSIIIAVTDAVYLLLMLEDRIVYFLAIITDVWHESMYSNVQGVIDNMANCALLQGTVTLCLHSIEGTFLIFYPIKYRQAWTTRRRLVCALFVNSACLVFFVGCEITHAMAGQRGRYLLYPIKNVIENGLFSILPICLMIGCYVFIIIGYRQHQSDRSTLTSTRADNSAKTITRLLTMTGVVYFTLGVPVDISKVVLVLTSKRGAVTFQTWLVKVIQSTMETLYGSAILSVFFFHKMLSGKGSGSSHKQYLKRKEIVHTSSSSETGLHSKETDTETIFKNTVD